jgi:hypothetical protein
LAGKKNLKALASLSLPRHQKLEAVAVGIGEVDAVGIVSVAARVALQRCSFLEVSLRTKPIGREAD